MCSSAPTSLVIDVDPFAEIRGVVRAVFEDSRGTLWIGGECDLFRNDGTTLTSYAIKDDLGRGVTIMKIVEDKAGNIWCGTTAASPGLTASHSRATAKRTA
jgi:ligand-binding sensor domain-containing protein